jgi:hypothetical protein
MNTPARSFGRHSRRNSVLLPALTLLASLLLTACGGGSSVDSNHSATASGEGNRAQALSVPPGWTGRAPRYEVINGITVPPEPAPSVNNATLAGVDINNNGVRDDVERTLARATAIGDTNAHRKALEFARSMQLALRSVGVSESETLSIVKAQLCISRMPGSMPAGLATSSTSGGIVGLTFNTPLRESALADFNARAAILDIEGVQCD